MCSTKKLWGVVVPTLARDYYRLRLCCYSYVLFLPLLVFHCHMVMPQRKCPPFPMPLLCTTQPYPTSPYCTPPPPGSSVHLDFWVPLSGVYYSWFLDVSSSIPFLYQSCISLSPLRIPPRSPYPPQSTPDPHAPKLPSLSTPLRHPTKKRLPMKFYPLRHSSLDKGLVCYQNEGRGGDIISL